MSWILRKVRKTIETAILTDRHNPRRLALSVAIGVFWGVTPFWGLHTAMSLLFCAVFRLNVPAALAGTFITNPWFAPFVIFLSLEVGSRLFYHRAALVTLREVRGLLRDPDWMLAYRELLVPYFWGSLVLSVLMALCAFFGVWLLARRLTKPPQ